MEDVKVIELNGELIKGTNEDIALILRQPPYCLSYRDIGKHLGVSRTTIYTMLKDKDQSGDVYSKDLLSKVKGMADEEIMLYLNLTSLETVYYHRSKFGIDRQVYFVNIQNRLEGLVKSLWGDQYTQGDSFREFFYDNLLSLIPTDKQKERMLDFYFNASPEENRANQRLRAYVRDNLRKSLGKWSVEKLIKKKVLQYG